MIPSLTSEILSQHRKDYFNSKNLQFGFFPLLSDPNPSKIYIKANNTETLQATSNNKMGHL